MRAWLLGGAILLAGGLAAAFLWTTTSTHSSTAISVLGCGEGGYGVGSQDFVDPPDGTFTIDFHDGDLVPIATPVGEYRLSIEVEGGTVQPVDRGLVPPAETFLVGGCSHEPGTAHYLARGEGTITVSFWMLGDVPPKACVAERLLFQDPNETVDIQVAAGEMFHAPIREGPFALKVVSADTHFHATDREADTRNELTLNGCAAREEIRSFVAEAAGHVRIMHWRG